MVYIIEKKEKKIQKGSFKSSNQATREPVRISTSTKEDVKIGHNINIECTADLKTKIQWFREDEALTSDELCGIIITESVIIKSDKKFRCSLLTIEDVEETDSGLYWCKSSSNPQDSDRIRINVVRAVTVEPSLWVTGQTTTTSAAAAATPAAPSVSAPSRHSSDGVSLLGGSGNRTLRPGERLQLRAETLHSPRAALRWYRGDEEIQDNPLAGVHISEKHDVRKNTKTSHLTIENVKQSHSDVYTCINTENESVVVLAIIKVK